MPRLDTSAEVTYTLVMNEQEKQWLSAYLQNAHGPESLVDKRIRGSFFGALNPPQPATSNA